MAGPDGRPDHVASSGPPAAGSMMRRPVDGRSRGTDGATGGDPGALFQAFMDGSPAVASIKDGAGRYVYVNTGWERAFGMTSVEALQKTDRELWPAVADRLEAADRAIRAAGRHLEFTESMPAPDGTMRRWLSQKFPLSAPSGETLVGCVAADITEYYRAEETLRASETRMSVAQRIAHIGNWEWDIASGAIWWSDEVYRLFGLWPGGFTPTFDAFIDAVHPDDRAAVTTAVDAAVHGGAPYSIDHRIRRTDGSERTVHSQGEVIYDDSGRPVRMDGTLQDITERVRAEEEVARVNRQNESILNAAGEGIYGVDDEGLITFVNRAACLALGFEEEELFGNSGHALLHHSHPDDTPYPKEDCPIYAAFKDGWVHRRAGEVFWRKDGTPFPVEYVSTPVLEGERLAGAVVVFRDISERLHAERAVQRESEARRAILDASPLAIFTVDPRGTVTSWNAAAERIFGWTAAEVVGKPYPLVPADRLEEYRVHLARAMSGEPLAGETVRQRKDGTPIDIAYWSSPLLDSSGAVTGVTGIFADITERKRSEEALRRYAQRVNGLHEIDLAILSAQSPADIAAAALKRLRALAPCRRATIVEFDADFHDGTILAVDCDGETALGAGARYPAKDVLGDVRRLRTVDVRVVKDLARARRLPPALEVLRSEGLRSYVVIPMRAQDVLVGCMTLWSDAPGALPEEHIGMAREVAAQLAVAIQQGRLREQVQRHAAELEERVAQRTEELREAQDRLTFALRSGRAGSWHWDLATGRAAWSSEMYAVLGLAPGECEPSTESWLARIHPEDRERATLRVTRSTGSTEPFESDYRVILPDGRVRWVSSRGRTVFDSSGRPASVAGILVDITDRKAVEAELRRKNEDLDAFANTVAHDLRTPLHGIRSLTGVLVEDYAAGMDENAAGYLRSIDEAAGMMDALVQDLLQYARLSRSDIQLEPVELGAVVDTVLGQLAPEITDKGAEVVVDGTLGPVLGHRATLAQVLGNLAGNALKFVAPGVTPRVRLACEERGADTRLWVEDNGIGIPVVERENIFRIFERLHDAEEYPGTGMGLAIVKKAVERMGGRVGVESEPGAGSRFWLQLPRAEGRAEAARPQPARAR